MDLQAATVPDLIQWFKSIREERSKLVAENDNETNADLVVDTTAAMRAVMKKIVSLTQGTDLATASHSDPSFSVETTGPPGAIVQGNNKSAVVSEPDPFREISLLATQFAGKVSRLTDTAKLSVATIQGSNTPSSFTGPGAPVRATTMRERTPLGSFGVIMKPDTTFLADTTTIISSMLDCDSRKNLASTSSAMNNLVHRNINLKRPAAQDQETTSKKKAKKGEMARNQKPPPHPLRPPPLPNHVALLDQWDQMRSKKARETNSSAGDQAEKCIA